MAHVVFADFRRFSTYQLMLPLALLAGLLSAFYDPALLGQNSKQILFFSMGLLTWLCADTRYLGSGLALLLSVLTGHQVTSQYLVDLRETAPKPEQMRETYEISGRFLSASEGDNGFALVLDQITILSPAETSLRLPRLTVYVPATEVLPKRRSQVRAWIRLNQRTQSHPIPWPMQRLRETYLPSFYGTVKDARLWSFEEAARPWSAALSKGNRELLGVVLDGAPSRIWFDRLEPFGVGHLLAISGLHCFFVFLGLQVLLIGVRRPWLRLLGTSIGLLLFADWVGWSASVTRAALMLIGWLCLPALGRARVGVRVWFGLMVLSLLAQGELLLMRGFWYSYGACLGLLVGRRLAAEPSSPLEHPLLRSLRPYLPIVSAQLCVIPISLMFEGFSRVSSLFWNFLGIIFLGVLGLLLCGALLANAVGFLVAPVNGLEAGVARVLRALSSGEHSIELVRFPQSPLLVALCVLMVALLMRFCVREWRWYAALACVLGFCVLGRPLTGSRFVMLDVGQGSCFLHVDEQGRGVIYDAGGKLPPPLRLDRVAKLMGAREIGKAYVSHLDLDHYQLLEHVPRRFPLWVPVHQAKRFRETAMLEGFDLVETGAGDRDHWGSDEVEVLWPAGDGPVLPSDNEGSLVLAVQGLDSWSLLTGDGGTWMESRLTLPVSRRGLTLLQIGHHGSKSATSEGFLERLKPEVGLISCGAHNRFNHPHPSVVQRLQREGVHVYQSAAWGSLILTEDGRWRLEALDAARTPAEVAVQE